MRKAIFTAITLLLLLIPLTAHANFKIELQNDTEDKLIYRVFWIDQDWYNSPFPAAIMGGELKAGDKMESSSAYKPGHYSINWMKDGKSIGQRKFYTQSDCAKVIISSDEIVFFKGV